MPRNAAPQHPLRRRDRQNAPDPCPRALRARSPFCGRTDSHDRTSPLNTASRLTSPFRRCRQKGLGRRLGVVLAARDHREPRSRARAVSDGGKRFGAVRCARVGRVARMPRNAAPP
jgi:hypothetical protein